MPRTPLLVGCLLVAVSLRSNAQQVAGAPARPQLPAGVQSGPSGQPARDARAVPTGRARIRGRVTIAGTSQPARRATVRLTAPNPQGGRTATTDLDGRYEFASLPAGEYSLQASKTGFLSLSYGQTRTTSPPKRLPIVDGQNAEGIDLLLLRGGAITGRVVDEFGDPVAGAVVAPLIQQYTAGRTRFVPNGPQATTNDLGEYRLSALMPRTYVVMAFLRQGPTMIINGQPVVSDDQLGFAPVFYPGTADAPSAAKIAIAPGQTAAEINFSLSGARLSRISGVALNDASAPLGAGNVMATPRSGVQTPTYSGQMSADGTFVIAGVPPGEYALRANARPGMSVSGSMIVDGFVGTVAMPAQQLFQALPAPPPPPPPPPASLPAPGFGQVPPQAVATGVVSVNGGDVSGVVLAPVRKVTARGRVVFDPRSAEARPDAARIRINAQLLNPEDQQGQVGAQPPPLKDDFSFEISLTPGLTMLRPLVGLAPQASTPNPWVMHALRVNGVDRLDTGFEVRQGDNLDDIAIELTTRVTEIAGTVASAPNAPAANHVVFVFPQDRELWIMLGPERFIQTRSDDQGRFTARNLRSGRYYVVAFAEIDGATVRDPDVLQSLAQLATAVSLDDGEKKSIQIKPSVAAAGP